MDISSINDGTVDTKGWLNPTVGTLRAKKIICDDIEGGGGPVTATIVQAQEFREVSPNADNLYLSLGGAVSCHTTANFNAPALNLVTYTQVSATGSEKNFIFPNNLVVGSMFEYYMAGWFSNPTGTSGSLRFYPTFTSSAPSSVGTYMNVFLIPFPAAVPPFGGQSAFELKITFRVTAFTNTTVTCESMHTGIAQGPETAVTRIERGFDPQPTITLDRTLNYVIPFTVWAQGDGYTFTRTMSYLRQIR